MEESNQSTIGQRIRDARKRAGFTNARDLAEASKGMFTESAVRNWEIGIRRPSIEILNTVAAICRVSAAWLAGMAEHPSQTIKAVGAKAADNAQVFMPDDSMHPTFQIGDLLDVEPIKGSPTLEGYIAFRNPAGALMVRYFRPTVSGLMSISTCNPSFGGAEEVPLEVAGKLNIIGRVIGFHRSLKSV